MDNDNGQQNEHHQDQHSQNPLNSGVGETSQAPPPPYVPQGQPVPANQQPQNVPGNPFPPTPAPVAPGPAAHTGNPGLIVLQWLTYAFWGWTVFATSLLTISVLANFIGGADDSSFIPYAVASVLVLLPISITCDVFYSKQEPERKTGAASIVMVIHAVLFALFCIGTLIAIVISLIQLMTSGSDTTDTQVALYSEMIITVLYAAVFLRTLRPAGLAKFRRLFPIMMVIAVGVISILGLVGPVAHARLTRNDRLIDDNLPSIQQSVNDYADSHNKLPDSLNSINLIGDEKKVVESNLVQYLPNSKPPSILRSSTNGSATSTTLVLGQQAQLPETFYYQLCVNYKKASKDKSSYSYSGTTDSSGYSDYISTTNHPAGKVCYKASTTANY